MCSITLTPADRAALLERLATAPDPATRQRALILLLLHAGATWAVVTAGLGCSSATVARWAARYRKKGLGALAGPPRRPRRLAAWAAAILAWVLTRSPREFRLARSRWSCEAVAAVLAEGPGVRAGRETVRLALRAEGLVWRRPRPVVRRRDPDRDAKLASLRQLLRGLPDGETAVFMDEVEVHTNPKVGCMWMRRGEQAAVETPGDNEKRVLAGSLHWRTGRLVETPGGEKEGRTAGLFCRHLDDLRRAFRRYRVVHVICDNAFNHQPERSRLVRAYLARWGGRVRLHFLPKYSPDCNPIERVWWRLHEAVTRNHRCKSLEELLDLTFEWLAERRFFRVRDSVYTAA
jgi:transposase